MVALPLDNEFMAYWLKLSLPEKESLLSVAKNFVELKKDIGRIMDNDQFYTHEQAVQISKSRLNE